MTNNTNLITLDSVVIKRDAEGRYCLNDLYRASGGESKHRPSLWAENKQTKELIDVATVEAGIPALVSISGGRTYGTWVVKELVYAYAMWVSPTFHLKVIDFFDRGMTQGVAVADHAAEAVLEDPLTYLKKVVDQALELKAQRDALAAEKAVLAPKAEVFDTVVADKRVSVSKFCRTFEGVNLLKVKLSLSDAGYLYKKADQYRVYRKYAHLFEEKISDTYGTWEIYPTAEGKAVLGQLYQEGKLAMRKAFA